MIVTKETHDVTKVNIANTHEYTAKVDGKLFDILLSKLYNDPKAAVVREYSTNARDAHVAAGKQNEPFALYIPNILEHNFIVEDFGTGLSKDDVFKYLGSILMSNKETSNEMVGALGLGSKSFASVSDSCIIVSRYQNTEYTFVSFRDSSGIPQMLLSKEEPTTEQNGIRFSIPVSDYDGYRQKVVDELLFFSPKPTIKNLSDFEWPNEIIELENEYGRISRFEYKDGTKYNIQKGNGIIGVMGGVSYNIPYSMIDDTFVRERIRNKTNYSGSRMIFEFAIGEVGIVPSRESLLDNKETHKTINERANNFIQELDKQWFEMWEAARTFDEALEVVQKVRNADRDSFTNPKWTTQPTSVENYAGSDSDVIDIYLDINHTSSYGRLSLDSFLVKKDNVLVDYEYKLPETMTYLRPKHSTGDQTYTFAGKDKDKGNVTSLSLSILDYMKKVTLIVVDDEKNLLRKINHYADTVGKKLVLFYPKYDAEQTVTKHITDFFDLIGFEYVFASSLSKGEQKKRPPKEKKEEDDSLITGLLNSDKQRIRFSDINKNTVYVMYSANYLQSNIVQCYEQNNDLTRIRNFMDRMQTYTDWNFVILQKTAWRHEEKLKSLGAIDFDSWIQKVMDQNELEIKVDSSDLSTYNDFSQKMKEKISQDLRFDEFRDSLVNEENDFTLMIRYGSGINLTKLNSFFFEKYEEAFKNGKESIERFRNLVSEYVQENTIRNAWFGYDKQAYHDRLDKLFDAEVMLKKYIERFGEI